MWTVSRRWILAVITSLTGLAAMARKSPAQQKGDQASNREKKGGRIEPLFTSEADARAIMQAHCVANVDAPLSAEQVDFLVSRLRPQLWLADRTDGGGGLGETRLGGAPDLPKGMAWPIRPALPEAAKAELQSRQARSWIVRQIGQAVPFEFIGQIELSAASPFALHAQGLPPTGRLSFFLDIAVLMQDPRGGPQACLVIYDATGVDGLERLAIPALFADMEAWWRDPDPKQIEHFKTMARHLDAAGQKEAAKAMRAAARKSETPDPTSKKPFVYPARAKQLMPLWVLPKQNTVELTLDSALTAFAHDDQTSEHYSLLTGNDIGPFTSDRSNMRRTQDWLMLEARRTRLLGPPDPEQDDPRYAALPARELPPYPWNPANIAEAARKAEAWQLLLQVSIADLSQEQTEGTVYFMILKSDLAARDFSRVVASYQQT